MRIHKSTVNRNKVFNPKNLDFGAKFSRLHKLLKNSEEIKHINITEKNIDSLLNNANKVRYMATNRPKLTKIVEPKLKESITFEPKPLVVTNEEILHRKLLDIRKRYDIENRSHGQQTSIIEGFVYIIVNPSYPDWIKAGMAFDYEKRLSVYNQYDPESKYSILALRWTAHRRLSEIKLLECLTAVSMDRKGEWFKIDKDISLNIFYSFTE